MTKAELTAAIMEHTTEYKKTNLMKMRIAELEQLYTNHCEELPVAPQLPSPDAPTVGSADEPKEFAQPKESRAGTTIYTLASEAYDRHKKRVKGPKIDRTDFRNVAIQSIIDTLANYSGSNIDEVTIDIIDEMLLHKSNYYPINTIEQKMLATIPVADDYKGADSIIDGKKFLQKVEAIHGIPISTTRSLMVALSKKGFYQIKGKKSGQKHTTIHLLPRGIAYVEAI